MAGSKHKGHEVTETPDVSHVRNVDVTHELSDVNIPAILKFVVALTVLTAVVFGLMWGLFKFLDERKQEPARGPMAMTEEERLPPEPRLQGAKGFGVDRADGQRENLELTEPQAEYRVLREQWERTLQEGARDESGKVVGQPIEESMKRLVDEKVISERPGQESRPLDELAVETPTSASSGRVSEKRRQ